MLNKIILNDSPFRKIIAAWTSPLIHTFPFDKFVLKVNNSNKSNGRISFSVQRCDFSPGSAIKSPFRNHKLN